MLKDRNIIIKEPYASEIRDKLRRYRKGEFTEQEKEQIDRSKRIQKLYEVEWK